MHRARICPSGPAARDRHADADTALSERLEQDDDEAPTDAWFVSSESLTLRRRASTAGTTRVHVLAKSFAVRESRNMPRLCRSRFFILRHSPCCRLATRCRPPRRRFKCEPRYFWAVTRRAPPEQLRTPSNENSIVFSSVLRSIVPADNLSQLLAHGALLMSDQATHIGLSIWNQGSSTRCSVTASRL